jgi:mediator of RNA polymerase II transcription subunit 4
MCVSENHINWIEGYSDFCLQATSIYQAKQKLQSISRANKRPVPSEDLIKFAHRISASNAVCAPLTWQQGDPRRPYPTGNLSH